MQDFTIERLGQPNLDFSGDLIGRGGNAPREFRIYRTKAGKYIGEQRFGPNPVDAAAQVCNTPAEVLNWFTSRIGTVTPDLQAALEDAASHDNGFKTFWNEQVP